MHGMRGKGRRSKLWNENNIAFLTNLAKKGLSAEVMRNYFSSAFSVHAIRGKMRDLGLNIRPRNIPIDYEAYREQFVELWAAGISRKEIGTKLKISTEKVDHLRTKFNLPIRTPIHTSSRKKKPPTESEEVKVDFEMRCVPADRLEENECSIFANSDGSLRCGNSVSGSPRAIGHKQVCDSHRIVLFRPPQKMGPTNKPFHEKRVSVYNYRS